MASHERTTVVPTITMRARLQGVWGSDHSYHEHNNTITITSCSVSSLGWVWARESQKVATLSQDTRAVTSSAETRVVMNTSTTLHLWRCCVRSGYWNNESLQKLIKSVHGGEKCKCHNAM